MDDLKSVNNKITSKISQVMSIDKARDIFYQYNFFKVFLFYTKFFLYSNGGKMEIYKYGEVISKGKTYIIFESNFSGSLIYVPSIEAFKVKEKIKIFIYKYNTDFTSAIYGFRTFKERILFEDLIGINGIGPKTAIGLLKEGKDNLVNMLINGDVDGLSSFPYLGKRTANQIVFELSNKYKNLTKEKPKDGMVLPSAVIQPLKTLGFKKHQIDIALKHIKPQPKIELLVEEAIKVISNVKFT